LSALQEELEKVNLLYLLILKNRTSPNGMENSKKGLKRNKNYIEGVEIEALNR